MAEQLTRSQRAAAAIKNIETLGKEINKPASAKLTSGKASPTAIQASGLPMPVAGTSFVQILM